MISDTHFGIYTNNMDKWLNMMEKTFYDFVIPTLKKTVKDGDIMIHLGDLFDNRTSVPIIVSYKVEKILIEISKILPLHIIVGNHDLYNKGSNDVNSLRLFNHIPNITIYSETKTIELDNKKIVLMPWVEKRLDMIREINNNIGDYLFCHSDLNGCKMHLNSVSQRNPDKIDVSEFHKYKHVYMGHIHLRDTIANSTFIGSLYHMDRNDIGDQKGITVLDLSTEKETFIPNNISPIFKKFKVENEEDIERLDDIKDTKDYIDLSISNNLLINNRKLRRKLELMLEKGNFTSVDYIDDITKDLIDGEEKVNNESIKLDENGVEISTQLEYDDYIKEYILKQTYENEKFKSGIVNEFDEIIKIYNENYKSNSE